MMRNLLCFALAASICCLFGCVPPPETTQTSDTFLSINVTNFGSPEALALVGNATTAQSNVVELPAELVQSAPEEITMTLSTPEIDPSVAAGHLNPLSKDGAFHATITFHLAPPGEDACASPIAVGPYNLSWSDGSVQIEKSEIPLPAEAAELVRGGRFEICAETSADFDGALSVSQLIIEFGRLSPGDTRVEICHIPPGNPAVRHTIVIGSSALQAHLDHGDYVGPCLETVEALQLTSVCSDNPDAQRRWRIHNPNTFAVNVTWEVYGTSQTGSLAAPPGDSYFETTTAEGPNTTTIRWMDHNGVVRSTAKASSGTQCILDSDGDGVPDPSDLCAATPAGESVDSLGCSCTQKDTDSDGVNDCTDACPGTAEGLSVDPVGCALSPQVADADIDGVPNAADRCPATPPGEFVDADGCSCSQLDEDSDAVSDCDDFCPGTPPGSPTDATGCEIVIVDAGPDVLKTEVGPVTLNATVLGGTPPYTYTWSALGWAGSSEQTPVVMPSQTTVYTVTVADWSFPPQIATDTVTVRIAPRQGLQYTIVNVGSLSTKNSYANGLNDLGQVVGYYYSETWTKRAFLFSNGVMTDLGTLGGAEAYASAINNNGQVVGQATNPAGQWHAFLWDAGGGMHDLGTLGGNASEAYAINNNGQVVGFSATATGNQAFIYSGGAMTQVAGTAAYAQSGAFDINDSADMAGILLTAGGASVAFKYSGSLVNLGSPLLTGSEAWLINDSRIIAGHSWGAGQYRSFIYANGIAVDLGLLTGFERTYAWGLSNNGQVVGSVTNALSGLSHAFIYTGGKLIDLNSLLAPNHGWEYLTAGNAINSTGQIAGYGKINGQYRGFLLTPNQ